MRSSVVAQTAPAAIAGARRTVPIVGAAGAMKIAAPAGGTVTATSSVAITTATVTSQAIVTVPTGANGITSVAFRIVGAGDAVEGVINNIRYKNGYCNDKRFFGTGIGSD